MSRRSRMNRYAKPEDECKNLRCRRDKVEPDKTDGWTLLGLCEEHVKVAKEIRIR